MPPYATNTAAMPGQPPNLLTPFMSLFGIGGAGQGGAATQLAGQGINPVTLNTTQSDADRAQQQSYLQALQAQMAGTGPSLAQAQLNQGIQTGLANQLAASQSNRYGMSPAAAAYGNAQRAAGMEGAGAASAANLKAQEMLGATQAFGSGVNAERGQDLGAAATQAGLTQGYNQMGANLYGQEQGQQNQFGQKIFGGLTNALGGALGMGGSGSGGGSGAGIGSLLGMAGAAKGGVVGGDTYLGEKAPELAVPVAGGRPALVNHPMLTHLAKPSVVLPLKRGSAPYKPGPLPTKAEAPPAGGTKPGMKIDPMALAAMAGKRPAAAPQRGIAPLSPATAPVVRQALGGVSGPAADHIRALTDQIRRLCQGGAVAY
jgi:hypothetical protein